MFLITGCESLDLPKATPACVEEKIKIIRKENTRNPPASVWQYSYDGKIVYYIPSRCCDIPSQLFDSSCNFICSPDGGFTGAGDGVCRDFFDLRTEEKLIWNDSRK
jgi:hypothetical protein